MILKQITRLEHKVFGEKSESIWFGPWSEVIWISFSLILLSPFDIEPWRPNCYPKNGLAKALLYVPLLAPPNHQKGVPTEANKESNKC